MEDKVITGQLLGSYVEVIRSLGGMPEAFLTKSGIVPSSLDNPASEYPLLAVCKLLEESASSLKCKDLGLRLAERQSDQLVMKPLDRLLPSARNIEQAIQCAADHMGAFGSSVRLTLEYDADRELHFQRFIILLDGPAASPQLVEQISLLSCNSIASLSAGAARSREIWFSHRRLGSTASYARRFRVPVKFEQGANGIFFKSDDLMANVATHDTKVFISESREIAARFLTRPVEFEVMVQHAIIQALANGAFTREDLAQSLGMNSRTVSRRLRHAGTSFEAMRDEGRRIMALRYLPRNDLTLTEIAGRLGYSELAVLSRSCQRWFGATPSALRQTYLQSAAPPADE